MISPEQRVILLLIKPDLQEKEEKELLELLQTHMNWSSVLGMIIVHRVAGIAYKQLSGIVKKIPLAGG